MEAELQGPTRPRRSAPRRVLDAAIDLLYPTRCVHCGRFGPVVCGACLSQLDHPPTVPLCPYCQARWDGPHNCPRCVRWHALDGAVSVAQYEGVARDIVRALKYRHTKDLAGIMAERMRPLLEAEGEATVFPIPLHRSRLRERGFNQAELIVSRLECPPAEGMLVRLRKTRPQFGLSHADRTTNVAGAFGYRGPSLEGQRVVVIDDVITTGATVNECARVLRDAGAISVRAMAFARASYESRGDTTLLEL